MGLCLSSSMKLGTGLYHQGAQISCLTLKQRKLNYLSSAWGALKFKNVKLQMKLEEVFTTEEVFQMKLTLRFLQSNAMPCIPKHSICIVWLPWIQELL